MNGGVISNRGLLVDDDFLVSFFVKIWIKIQKVLFLRQKIQQKHKQVRKSRKSLMIVNIRDMLIDYSNHLRLSVFVIMSVELNGLDAEKLKISSFKVVWKLLENQRIGKDFFYILNIDWEHVLHEGIDFALFRGVHNVRIKQVQEFLDE